MITEIEIKNYKSVHRLKLRLGRLNIFIGENGCGKSNILESIAVLAAASQSKLDNEFLASRGVRVTSDPRFMRGAFADSPEETRLSCRGDKDLEFGCALRARSANRLKSATKEQSQSVWDVSGVTIPLDRVKLLTDMLKDLKDDIDNSIRVTATSKLLNDLFLTAYSSVGDLTRFLVYSPENSALRQFLKEGQILPLGVNGEGLFAHLKDLSRSEDTSTFEEITSRLRLLGWFKSFSIPDDLSATESRMSICDRYLREGALFDQVSTNEGFMFLLFYFTLFASPITPSFFAIDNVDVSLNPKLCAEVVGEMVTLSKQHDKQAILTTHNAAILDGIDLADDDQRLFVISRSVEGYTQAARVKPPRKLKGAPEVRLSEAFLRGYLGGLPNNF